MSGIDSSCLFSYGTVSQAFLGGGRNEQEEVHRNHRSVCDSGWRRSSGSDTYANKG